MRIFTAHKPYKLVLYALYLAVTAFVLGEIAARLFATYAGTGARKFYVKDPELGHWHASNYRGSHAREGVFNVRVLTDGDGFRTGENANAVAPDEQVLLVGDSFAFGYGVEFEDTMGARLDALMDKARVMNCGVSGYGTRQEAVLLERIATRHKPSLVILEYYVGNDIRDTLIKNQNIVISYRLLKRYSSMRAWEGYFDAGSQAFIFVHGYPSREASRLIPRCLDHCFLYYLGLNAFGQYPMVRYRASISEYATYSLREYPPLIEQAFEESMECVARMNALSGGMGARFLVVLVPYKWQMAPERFDEALAKLGGQPEHFDMDEPQKRICGTLKEKRIEHLDLLPILRQHEVEGKRPYFDNDVHWTPEGHNLVAVAIHAYLKEGPHALAP